MEVDDACSADSPFQTVYVLDNSVVSALHQADALATVLELWMGRWVMPEEVKREAGRWPIHGTRVEAIIEVLWNRGVAARTAVDPLHEGPLFARLNLTLGEGESATVAIAYHRGFGAALDDYAARRECGRLIPSVPWIATEALLKCAIKDGLLSRSDALGIWQATGIRDPKRGLF